MEFMSTPFKEQKKLVKKESLRRGEKIDEVAEKFLNLLVENEMTMNDAHVILNQLTQQMQQIFLSHQVNQYVDKK